MFEISQKPLLLLDTQGLEDPPEAEGFSTQMSTSYFAQAGIDVSCTWIDAQTYAKAMAQHEANFETPTLVTVREISDLMLGPVAGKRIVYWKSRPVPNPEAPTELLRGAEATWQYLWPADKGETYGMLTIWRAGFDAPEALEQGFDEIAQRFEVQGQLDTLTLNRLKATSDPRGIMVSGIGIADGVFPWGRICAPAWEGSNTWRIQINHSQAPEFFIYRHQLKWDLHEQIQQIMTFASDWGDGFKRFDDLLAKLDDAARNALAAYDEEPRSTDHWSVVLTEIEVNDDLSSLRAYFEIEAASEFFSDHVMVTLGSDGTIFDAKTY